MECQTFDRSQMSNYDFVYNVLLNPDSDMNRDREVKRPVPADGIYEQLTGYLDVDVNDTLLNDHVTDVAKAAVDFYNNKHNTEYAMICIPSAKFIWSYPTAFLITVLTDKDIYIKAELASYGRGKKKDFWVCEITNEAPSAPMDTTKVSTQKPSQIFY